MLTVSLSLLCLYIYLLFFPLFPPIILFLFPCHNLLSQYYSSNFSTLVAMLSIVYRIAKNGYIILQLQLNFFGEVIIFLISLLFIMHHYTLSNFGSQSFIDYACKHPTIPALFSQSLSSIIFCITYMLS